MTKEIKLNANDAVTSGVLEVNWSYNTRAISPLALDFKRDHVHVYFNLPRYDAKRLALFILENL